MAAEHLSVQPLRILNGASLRSYPTWSGRVWRDLTSPALAVPPTMDHSPHSGHGGHGGSGELSKCSMNMLFTWDTTDLCVVFRWWHVRTNPGLVLTLLTIIALSAGYEYLRYRIRLIDIDAQNQTTLGNTSNDNSGIRLRQSIGYALQVGYSYLLMLIFMSYNGWAMLSVAVGAGLGFWIWGGDRAQKSMSCH